MSDATAINGRIAASRSRIAVVDARVRIWVQGRRDADPLEQYASQLDAISSVLGKCLEALSATLPAESREAEEGCSPASTPDDPAAVYETCRMIDRRTSWTSRLLGYFADRFGRRDPDSDEPEPACLRAADEVVWSCWRPAFAAARQDPRPAMASPVPLPYLDPIHSPEVFPPTVVPSDLGPVYGDAPFIREHLERLPVPVVRTPVACVTEPWMLALLAHETGHHLQYANRLGNPFTTAVRGAVLAAGGTELDAERWSGWCVEIFADLASVAMLGPWALWPIAELELGTSDQMARTRTGYPPAGVRLSLLASAIRQIDLDPGPAWPVGAGTGTWAGTDLPVPDDSARVPDGVFLDRVVRAGLAIGPAGLTMTSWLGLNKADFAAHGLVDQWRDWLLGGRVKPQAPKTPSAARVVTAGIVAATAAARGAATGRDERLNTIRERAYPALVGVRPPGRRAAEAGPQAEFDSMALGQRLVAHDFADQLDLAEEWLAEPATR